MPRKIEEIKARTIKDWLKLIDKADSEHSPSRRADYADAFVDVLREIFDDDRLEQICSAERDGLLRIMHCKIGTPVWYVGVNCDECDHLCNNDREDCKPSDVVYNDTYHYWMLGLERVYFTPDAAAAALKEQEER